MTLIVETGQGVPGAESYASVAYIDAYWLARPHRAEALVWNGATVPHKEGAAREASAFIDARWGQNFRGTPRGQLQGRAWPRSGAEDDAGYPLPDLPPILAEVTAELAGRAISAPLAADQDTGRQVQRVKAGSTEVEFAPNAGTVGRKVFGSVEDMLAPLLASSGGAGAWAWR